MPCRRVLWPRYGSGRHRVLVVIAAFTFSWICLRRNISAKSLLRRLAICWTPLRRASALWSFLMASAVSSFFIPNNSRVDVSVLPAATPSLRSSLCCRSFFLPCQSVSTLRLWPTVLSIILDLPSESFFIHSLLIL